MELLQKPLDMGKMRALNIKCTNVNYPSWKASKNAGIQQYLRQKYFAEETGA